VADDVRLSVARARLLEWRRRDPRGALAVVEDARRRMPEAALELELRHHRLLRKVSKRAEAPRRKPRPEQLEAAILNSTG
jgi:hypothetical protein